MRKRKHNAAQFEFGYSANCFNLAGETAAPVPEASAPKPVDQVDPKQTELDKSTYSLVPELKAQVVRECHTPAVLVDTPDRAAAFWHQHIEKSSWYRYNCEQFCVLLLNTRRRLAGWSMVSMGTLDTILVHPREVFQIAVMQSAAAVILMHNHPSGDATPSEADIKVTRDLIRAGQLLKIDVLDHVIAGKASETNPKDYCSLRELGYFYS